MYYFVYNDIFNPNKSSIIDSLTINGTLIALWFSLCNEIYREIL